MLDLERFLREVADAGLYAIVRPGPYICAEWDNGGLPAWLFREPGMGVRRYEPRFMAAVQEYLEQVLRIVAAAAGRPGRAGRCWSRSRTSTARSATTRPT